MLLYITKSFMFGFHGTYFGMHFRYRKYGVGEVGQWDCGAHSQGSFCRSWLSNVDYTRKLLLRKVTPNLITSLHYGLQKKYIAKYFFCVGPKNSHCFEVVRR